MKALPHPAQAQRLQALYSYEVLDTDREVDFDDIVKLASAICGTAISVVNLIDVDRQWFKAEVGLGVRETPIETSLCAHAILEKDFTEIRDTLLDPRMADNPLCAGNPGLRFYAGALLVTDSGLPLGTLCVLDYEPRELTPLQRDALRVLARQVMVQLEMRKALKTAKMLRQEVDHRVKNSLQSLSSIMRIQARSLNTDEAVAAVAAIGSRLNAVSAMHERLYMADAGSNLDLGAYVESICQYLAEMAPEGVTLKVSTAAVSVSSKQAVSVGTLINEFVSNSFKHAFPNQRQGEVEISLAVTATGIVQVACRDNGVGPPTDTHRSDAGLGLKIAEVTCMELNCDLDIRRESPGISARFEFQPTLSR